VSRRAFVMKELGLSPVWVRRQGSNPAASVEAGSIAGVQATEVGNAAPSAGSAPAADRAAQIHAMDWAQLKSSASACTTCILHKRRKQAVLGVGDEKAEWLFVGEGPGAEEDERGEPFVGQAGKLLDIADTGIKAAILKCATDEPGVTPGVERVLRAVAQAHRHTGVPISTHTHAGTRRGLEQQRIFAEEGIDLSRVVIGHSGDTTDVDYLEELIGNGSYIGMDRFGIDVYLPFEDRVDTVARMCERGHAEKMVLSHDANCYWDALPEETLPVVMPNWHYLHIHNDVIPALKDRGVTDEQLTTMLVDNPRKIFENQGAY